jgi:hypothetical protein
VKSSATNSSTGLPQSILSDEELDGMAGAFDRGCELRSGVHLPEALGESAPIDGIGHLKRSFSSREQSGDAEQEHRRERGLNEHGHPVVCSLLGPVHEIVVYIRGSGAFSCWSSTRYNIVREAELAEGSARSQPTSTGTGHSHGGPPRSSRTTALMMRTGQNPDIFRLSVAGGCA